ncbi:hypothetical protein CDAR_79141 [Caerostris darwini]|uniref:Prolactin receptor n=1 Tax=Caerostris darwini TaxID=1538125 RepID=A0AAV4S6I8_9ARAC|nr:hypothetical protein CDAR_79141 [Caerostris darwini]
MSPLLALIFILAVTGLDNVGSDPLPVLIEFNKRQSVAYSNKRRWNFSLDPGSSNELWRLVKSMGEEQPQMEKCNIIKSNDGKIARNDIEAANLLDSHYQSISKLDFTKEDRHIKHNASSTEHGCRSCPLDSSTIFSRAFSMQELTTAISESSLNKSPGHDGVHGQSISNLGLPGRRLKRNSPFSMVASAHLLESKVEQHTLVQCVDPSDGLPNVHFHTDLSVQVNKQDDLPVYLKQLALK